MLQEQIKCDTVKINNKLIKAYEWKEELAICSILSWKVLYKYIMLKLQDFVYKDSMPQLLM